MTFPSIAACLLCSPLYPVTHLADLERHMWAKHSVVVGACGTEGCGHHEMMHNIDKRGGQKVRTSCSHGGSDWKCPCKLYTPSPATVANDPAVSVLRQSDDPREGAATVAVRTWNEGDPEPGPEVTAVAEVLSGAIFARHLDHWHLKGSYFHRNCPAPARAGGVPWDKGVVVYGPLVDASSTRE